MNEFNQISALQGFGEMIGGALLVLDLVKEGGEIGGLLPGE